jgi:uncharacterized membrane protein YdjX (TVP38/TMEM64 family)
MQRAFDGKRLRMLPRVLTGLALATLLVLGVAVAKLYPGQVEAFAGRAAQAQEALGVIGWLLAAGLQTLIALCGILPASVGAFAMGVAYGVHTGFLLSGVGTIIGAVLAFLLARGLFRAWAKSWFSRHSRLSRLDDAVCRDGWRLVALMRLSPVMPFAMTSYALGLTSLSLRAYLIGTLASLPALLGYVAMGHFARLGAAALSGSTLTPLRWGIFGLAVAATALLTFRLASIARFVMRLPDAENAQADATRPISSP